MRLLIEVLYVGLSLVVIYALTAAAAWSYPLGDRVIWSCGAAAAAATMLMAIGPLRTAWRIGRAPS